PRAALRSHRRGGSSSSVAAESDPIASRSETMTGCGIIALEVLRSQRPEIPEAPETLAAEPPYPHSRRVSKLILELAHSLELGVWRLEVRLAVRFPNFFCCKR